MVRSAIQVTGLRKAYGEHAVLDGLDLAVDEGTVFALLGPNGAGKTTLIRILSTLTVPDAGRVEVAGHDVTTDPQAVRRAISLTGQFAAVDEVLTGVENLAMVARLAGFTRAAAADRAAELLEMFDLVAAGERRVATYSGGMRRRLDLAAGLVADPAVLFLDEPTTGLDTRSRNALWELIGGLRRRGTTVLLTTQYLDEADHLADRIGVLDGGRLVAEGTGADLKARVGPEVVAALRFATEAEAASAAAALGADVAKDAGASDPGVADSPEREARDDHASPVVLVATDGSGADLRRILDALAAHGVDATRVDLRRPSLDDVFLRLTGSARVHADRTLETTAS